MITLTHPQTGLVQRLAVADLVGGVDIFLSMGALDVIYSDPPWNPGNEKWWRRHANLAPPCKYSNLLNAWCKCASMARSHVMCEQSVNNIHRQLTLEAISRCDGWTLPLSEQWVVQYGSPKRPNVLLHFGSPKLSTDPSGMNGERMTLTAIQGLELTPGSVLGDPCMGKGMTSRVAHKLGYNFVGTELNSKRLEQAANWLIRKGYVR